MHMVRPSSFRHSVEGTDIYPRFPRPRREVEEVEGETERLI